jgi:hypothetical protein
MNAIKFGFEFFADRLKNLLAKAGHPNQAAGAKGEKLSEAAEQGEEHENCCAGKVHIFYRGLADDHLYVARQRNWSEVKFFLPRGLKVFCQDCRRRLY